MAPNDFLVDETKNRICNKSNNRRRASLREGSVSTSPDLDVEDTLQSNLSRVTIKECK